MPSTRFKCCQLVFTALNDLVWHSPQCCTIFWLRTFRDFSVLLQRPSCLFGGVTRDEKISSEKCFTWDHWVSLVLVFPDLKIAFEFASKMPLDHCAKCSAYVQRPVQHLALNLDKERFFAQCGLLVASILLLLLQQILGWMKSRKNITKTSFLFL